MAAYSRFMMEECKIHPNSLDNGMYLRDSYRKYGTAHYLDLTPEQRDHAYHPRLHTAAYFTWIDASLIEAFGGSDNKCQRVFAVQQLHTLQVVLADMGETQPR